MTPRSRRLLAPLAVAAGTLAATAYVGLVDPNEAGHYPLCPTKALTGLDCPGCGGLRAIHSLVRGDLVGALDHNAFVVLVVVPVAVVLWIAWVVREWRGPVVDPSGVVEPPRPGRLAELLTRPRVVWTVVAVMVVFTVARNVAAVPALAWLGSTTAA